MTPSIRGLGSNKETNSLIGDVTASLRNSRYRNNIQVCEGHRSGEQPQTVPKVRGV